MSAWYTHWTYYATKLLCTLAENI